MLLSLYFQLKKEKKKRPALKLVYFNKEQYILDETNLVLRIKLFKAQIRSRNAGVQEIGSILWNNVIFHGISINNGVEVPYQI